MIRFNVSTPTQFQTALNTAINNNQADTINVAAGTYNLTSTLTYDLTPTTNDEQYPLTIVGAGAATAILNGGDSMRVMMIDCTSGAYGTVPSDANCDISISGLTFQNGYEYNGAGLYFNSFEADLVVENCIFINNEANSDAGGGLSADTRANVTLTSNIFNSNTAEYTGGGAYVVAGAYYGGTAYIATLLRAISATTKMAAVHMFMQIM